MQLVQPMLTTFQTCHNKCVYTHLRRAEHDWTSESPSCHPSLILIGCLTFLMEWGLKNFFSLYKENFIKIGIGERPRIKNKRVSSLDVARSSPTWIGGDMEELHGHVNV